MPPKKRRSPVNLAEVNDGATVTKKTKKKNQDLESKAVVNDEAEVVDTLEKEAGQEIEKENHPVAETLEPVEKEVGKRNPRRAVRRAEEKNKYEEADLEEDNGDHPKNSEKGERSKAPSRSNKKKAANKSEHEKKLEEEDKDLEENCAKANGDEKDSANTEEEEPQKVVSRSNKNRGANKHEDAKEEKLEEEDKDLEENSAIGDKHSNGDEKHPTATEEEETTKVSTQSNKKRGANKNAHKKKLEEADKDLEENSAKASGDEKHVTIEEEEEPQKPPSRSNKKRGAAKNEDKKEKLEEEDKDLEENSAIGDKHSNGDEKHPTNSGEEEATDVPTQSNKKRGVNKNADQKAVSKDASSQDSDVKKKVKGGKKKVHIVEKDEPVDGSDEPGSNKQESTGRGKRRVDNKKAEPEKAEDNADKSEPSEKKSKSEEDYDCAAVNKNGEKWNLKISSWNIAGMRAWIKKNGVDYVTKEDPDIMCFQETKCPESKVPAEAKLEGYHTYWASGTKDGYAGVSIYTKEKPINVTYGLGNAEHDAEGRLITAEFDKFYLVTVYVPNSGQALKTLPKRMEWDTLFLQHLKNLDEKKPVILCGDMNVAHQEIDLANPKTNTKHAGFTPEERENMTVLLKEGFVDSYRQLYPDKTGAYTFWTYLGNARSRNTGWRLDYFVVSERLMDSICEVAIRNKVLGSDHCPLTLFVHI